MLKKDFIRSRYILKRKKNYKEIEIKFFNPLINLLKKKKYAIKNIGIYYPSNFELDILKIVDNSNSDSTILGEITNASDGPFTFDSNEQVDEYRFSISLKILWVDNENEKNLIEKTFTGFGNYSINNDPSSDGIDNDNDGILDENDDDEFGDSRELAINIAINKIASDVVNSILSTW